MFKEIVLRIFSHSCQEFHAKAEDIITVLVRLPRRRRRLRAFVVDVVICVIVDAVVAVVIGDDDDDITVVAFICVIVDAVVIDVSKSSFFAVVVFCRRLLKGKCLLPAECLGWP